MLRTRMNRVVGLLTALLLASFISTPSAFAVISISDQGVYEADAHSINLGSGLAGALNADGSYTISGGPVGTDGNWTGDGVTTTLDGNTAIIITHGSGDLAVTGVTLGTADLTGDNAQVVDFGTNNQIIFTENSDSLDFEFDANDVIIRTSDGGVIFQTDATDGTGTIDFCARGDDDDCAAFDTISNVPTLITNGASNLGINPTGGTVVITGIVTVSGLLTANAGLTLGGADLITWDQGDTLDQVVDDEFRFESNDLDVTIEAFGFEANDGRLLLTADQADDAGDEWMLQSTAASNDLEFSNDTTTSGTHVLKLSVATTGIITTTNDLIVANDSATTNAVSDLFTISSTSTGTPAAGIGVGMLFQVEDGGTTEQQGSIDVVLQTVTDTSEDADMIFSLNTAGTINEVLRLIGITTATTGSSMTLTQITTETNAILDILSLTNSTGTAAANAGLGITWDFEDAGGNEEQASLDVQLTTATDASEDVSVIFSQQTAGAVAETLRIRGASSATVGDTLEFTSNTTETNAIIDVFLLKTATGTAAASSGIAISFEPEDATGSEKQADIQVVLTDATRATADVDFIFRQNVAGTIEERVRFDADGDTILVTGTLPNIVIGDAGAEDTDLTFDGNAQDFYVGLDDSADDLVIGVGATVGTTPAIIVDEDQETRIVRVGHTLDTTNQTLVEAGCGAVHMTATDALTYTLPATITGCMYTFIGTSADGGVLITIDPVAADAIYGTVVNAASDAVFTGTDDGNATLTKTTMNKGDRLTIIGDGVTGWFVIEGVGIWVGA